MASTGGGKDGSKGFVKRVTSTFSIRKKKNTPSDPKLLLPRSKSTGANYESMRLPQGKKALPDVKATNTKRTKSAGVSPQPRREKIDESGKQFMKMRCFDDSDSIWLSSDCASPTSLLEERRLSVSFHFSVDEKIVSWLSSVANSSLSLNQESTSSTKENHHHKTSSKNAKCSLENIRKDEKFCNSSAGKARGTGSAKPSSRTPESNNKTCPRKSCEESSSSNRLVSPDLTSQSPEEKKVSFSVETEKSPSPVNSTAVPSGLTKTTGTSSLKKTAETGDSKNNKIAVEPLFWPFEQKFDWTPEDILKHFSMSPRRKKSKIAGTSPRSMRAQLQTRKLDLKEGCKRKLMFNGPGTRIPELKRTISNSSNNSSNKKAEISKNQQPIRNSVKRNKSLPSRLRKSSKVSSKVVPIEATEETGDILKEQKTPKKLIMTRKSRTFLEDDFALMNDFSIEKAVGLCEFKGREGIDSDFNTDGFLFDDSL
ncbi:hypothetical protein ISN45_Aa04g015450 [Arabidopsis thaliana x Arabidopsis arenosa]|uniref:Uncharacterized protein n=1 Tax=Arabidopsis thaliana x Arabidopsis arenosa TaxID=1240361 RepID=A0A8T2AAM7_9BRAS|nr:hypothetical protein ISN45_Aa04g015450 [Arabidopsis thaliana x Arabidopsis arenosa]